VIVARMGDGLLRVALRCHRATYQSPPGGLLGRPPLILRCALPGYHSPMSTLTQTEAPLIRQARVAEILVIAWMVVELVVALAAGIAARSVALTAFGVDSGIEVFTALVVLRQLLLHTDRATAEELDARERQASRLVGWGLYGLVVYIVVSSGWSLLTRSQPESSMPGMALAIAALLVMTPLWRWRRRLADALDSPSLRGDAACSLVCIYMAATLLVGLLLNSLFGWWWADPLTGLAMIWWIRGEAREALEAARSGHYCDEE
jgi:divalent metal cation (Fe/Co/Zn/Cd) transporter